MASEINVFSRIENLQALDVIQSILAAEPISNGI